MEKKQLLKSQHELLKIKYGKLVVAESELRSLANMIAGELGVPPGESWELSKDLSCFEKAEEKPQ